MKHSICVITGTRADYGLLRGLLFRLRQNDMIDLTLVVTGSHLCESFGNTQQEIIDDGFDTFARIPISLEDDSKSGMATATGEAICRFSTFFAKHSFDLLVVLGDRYEIFASVIAARMCGTPIAHISGGDVTEGAIDDSIRHSITKMSHIHFPGCEQSRIRIIQMGEQPSSVFNVGEPGVENALKMELLTREELAKSISFDGVLNDYSIVTFHPVTMENNTGAEQVKELIQAMDEISGINYIITLANADAGGREINDIWISEEKKRSNWLVVPSLGVKRYLSAMKYACVVIGNSSSGIVEAPSMKVPTVNIGDRQKGRMLAKSVICCPPIKKDISIAIKRALSDEYKNIAMFCGSPFGDGTTSERIEKHISDYLSSERRQEKEFFDIPFNIEYK